jgi:predicted  nucleic acid-binding Zn-ribbon protein
VDLEQLLEVQDLDTRTAQLEHRLTHDATLTALASAQAVVADLARQELQLFGERDAVRQELKRLEDEASLTEDKIAKVNSTLYGGVVTAHKELESLQHELAMLKERLSGFEDLELEQMELAEPLEARAVELEAQQAAAAAAVVDAEMAVTAMQAEVGAELDTVTGDRAAKAAALPADLLAQYERIRSGAGGQGAARLAPGGRCEGCHLTLPTAEYDAIKHAPADEVHLCPECNRILVR